MMYFGLLDAPPKVGVGRSSHFGIDALGIKVDATDTSNTLSAEGVTFGQYPLSPMAGSEKILCPTVTRISAFVFIKPFLRSSKSSVICVPPLGIILPAILALPISTFRPNERNSFSFIRT